MLGLEHAQVDGRLVGFDLATLDLAGGAGEVVSAPVPDLGSTGGAKVTAVTISDRQHEYATERIRAAGYFDPQAVGRLFDKCRAGRATGFADNQAFVGVLSTMLIDRSLREGTDAATGTTALSAR